LARTKLFAVVKHLTYGDEHSSRLAIDGCDDLSMQMASKSFVDPRSCLSVFNHYCLRPLRQPSTTLVHMSVHTDIARSHHYRKCGFNNRTCAEYVQQQVRDDVTLRFKRRLQPAVEAVLHQLGVTT